MLSKHFQFCSHFFLQFLNEITYLHSYSTPRIEIIVLENSWSIPSIIGWWSPSLHCNDPHWTFLEKERNFELVSFLVFSVYSLWVAFDIMSCLIHATMSIHGTFWIKLFIALLISCWSTISPYFWTLGIQRWAYAIEAVSLQESRKMKQSNNVFLYILFQILPVAFSIPLSPTPQGLPFFM
jgi:hypothetical protein